MEKTVFRIEKMDCSAEERMVRMKLDAIGDIERMEFDLPNRQLAVYHTGSLPAIRSALDSLGLGTSQVQHEVGVSPDGADLPQAEERRPLVIALVINAALFVGELLAGLLAGSMGLVADSLDMLADAGVYAMSLAAVGSTVLRQKRIARSSGYFQLLLAVAGLVEVARRFIAAEGMPDFTAMIVVSGVAMVANIATLLVLNRAKGAGAHMQASWIFTSNDIQVNLLVIVSGVLVYFTASQTPDLIAGGLIFLIVANGARRILALSR